VGWRLRLTRPTDFYIVGPRKRSATGQKKIRFNPLRLFFNPLSKKLFPVNEKRFYHRRFIKKPIKTVT
ncbi:hypothetical protein ACVGXA_01295, partial [Enterobacter hormaechei]